VKKVFYVIVATTILATNPLLAMDEREESPLTKLFLPRDKSAETSDCARNQPQGVTLRVEEVVELINSGKPLEPSFHGETFPYRGQVEGKIYEITLSEQGMIIMCNYITKVHKSISREQEREKEKRTLGNLPLIDTQVSKWEMLTKEDRSRKVLDPRQKMHFFPTRSADVKFKSERYWNNLDDEPMCSIHLVSAEKLYREQEEAAKIAEKKAKSFMDLERVYKYNFKTVYEWLASGQQKCGVTWKTQIGDLPCEVSIDPSFENDGGASGTDSVYFESVESSVYESSLGSFPIILNSYKNRPSNDYGCDLHRLYFAGYVTGTSERQPVVILSYSSKQRL
jgi:hypothetical protein